MLVVFSSAWCYVTLGVQLSSQGLAALVNDCAQGKCADCLRGVLIVCMITQIVVSAAGHTVEIAI